MDVYFFSRLAISRAKQLLPLWDLSGIRNIIARATGRSGVCYDHC